MELDPFGLVAHFLDIPTAPGVVSWAEDNLEFPVALSPTAPGRFSTRARPYMREPLECFHPDSGITDLVLSWGAQNGKTTIPIVGLGYRLNYSAGPVLWVMPNEGLARSFSKSRWQKFVKANEVLAQHLPANMDDFTALEQQFGPATFNFVGSNSPANLASRACQIVVCDEQAKFAKASAEESSAADLADLRTQTFTETALRVKLSTPTSAGHEFWQHFLQGDQRYFHVSCPHCNEAIVLSHKPLESNEDLRSIELSPDNSTLGWDRHAKTAEGQWDEEKVRASAFFRCPECGEPIKDHQKPRMTLDGGWQPRNEAAERKKRSYQLSSLNSPDVRFGQMAVEYIRGRAPGASLQNYLNGYGGEPYVDSVRSVSEEAVRSRAGDFVWGTVPSGIDLARIIIGVDPGESVTHWAAIAVSVTNDIYVFDGGTMVEVEDVAELARRNWEVPGMEQRVRASCAFIDSGYNTSRVYDFCMRMGGWAWPTKGTQARQGTWTYNPIRSHRGLSLLSYADTNAKNELYEERIFKGSAPRFFIAKDAPHEVIKGFAGQEKIEVAGALAWKKIPDDHYGDCAKVAMVGSWAMSKA